MAKELKSAGMPRLRFSAFRADGAWKIETLGDLCEVLNNRRLPITRDKRSSGAFPYYGASGIVDYIGDYIFDERLLLVGEDGAKWSGFERTAFVAQGKYWVNNHAHVLKPTGATDAFLMNYLWMCDLSQFVTGAAPPKLTLGKLRTIPIPLPEKWAEQQKIADCLTSLDDVIEAQGQKVEALKTYKRGLMQQLFPREVEIIPRLRFPEFAGSSLWHPQKIRSLLKKASFAVSVEPTKMYREIGIRSHGKGIFHKEPTLGKVIGDKRVFLVVQDALVLNIVFAWEQAVATTSEREVGMIASHRFPMYLPNPGRCDVEYIKRFFLTKEGKRLLGVASPGGAGRNKTLGQKEFENLEISLPASVGEQTRIANCLSSLDAKIAAEIGQLDALRTHKMGLMQQLFPVPKERDA